MNRSALVVLLVAVVLLHTCEAKQVCQGGPHDRWTNCGSHCEPHCNDSGPKACILSCKLDSCQCKPNYLRRADGMCVEKKDCNNS